MMQTQETGFKGAPPSLERKRSCTTCAHMPVCGIYRAIAPLMKEFERIEPGSTNHPKVPFHAEELAKICTMYLPLWKVEIALSRQETGDYQ